MGMVIGFSPTVGAQALICLVAGLIWNKLSDIKMSLPAMLVGSIVVNPITMGPTYYVYYVIGCLVQTCDVEIDTEHFASLGAITEVGQSLFMPVVIGSIPFMVLGGPIGYWLGTKVERFLESRRAKRQGRGKLGFAAASSK